MVHSRKHIRSVEKTGAQFRIEQRRAVREKSNFGRTGILARLDQLMAADLKAKNLLFQQGIDISRLLTRTGGDKASKIAKTALAIRSAKGSTVAERRRRSRFVVPKSRTRTLTAQGLGVAVAPAKGLNIVI